MYGSWDKEWERPPFTTLPSLPNDPENQNFEKNWKNA